MRIIEAEKRSLQLIGQLLKVWESAVKTTHLFLSGDEIEKIKAYVPQALKGVQYLVVAENEWGAPAAFMGVDKQKLEMLFISPEEQGKGLGKRLVQYAKEKYSVNELAVNEQNPRARGFYEHMGFQVYKRAQKDEQGNPYPILYMKLDERQPLTGGQDFPG